MADLRQSCRVGSALMLVALAAGCSRGPAADPSRTNRPPGGNVDAPRNNEIVGREVDVSGWAVDDAGVAEVRIFVDGKQAASTGLTLPRPDVSKVHPTYATRGDVHGWQATVDLGEAETTHSIQVRVVDNQGATRDIGSVVVKVIGRN